MTTKTYNLTKAHDAVIDKWQANEAAVRKLGMDQLAETIRLTIGWYALVASTLLKESGLSPDERTTMRGGTFHGHVTGKKEHPLRYSGTRDYPSSTYCTRAFALHYLHTASRFNEYKATNTSPDKQHYVTWLQVMYGDSTGDHAKLQRDPESTIARFNTTPATKADKAAGRAFHSAVLKEVSRDSDGESVPGAIGKVCREVRDMTAAKRRNTAALYDISEWSQDDILSQIRASVAQYMINDAADKKAKAKAKANA